MEPLVSTTSTAVRATDVPDPATACAVAGHDWPPTLTRTAAGSSCSPAGRPSTLTTIRSVPSSTVTSRV